MEIKKKQSGPLFKVLLIGDGGVGKTSIIMATLGMEFTTSMDPTIGAEFKAKKILVNDKEITIRLQDTAGQQRYRAIANSYYKGSHGAFVVFDLTSESSFKNIKHWIRQLKNLASVDVHKIMLGNKADMKEEIKVSQADIDSFCTDVGIKYYEVSAKTRQNINQAVEAMAQELVKVDEIKRKEKGEQEEEEQDKMKLSALGPKKKPDKTGCCSKN